MSKVSPVAAGHGVVSINIGANKEVEIDAAHSPAYLVSASSTSSDEADKKGCCGVFRTRTRFLLMVLVLLCLASIWSNILAFNFALICFIPSRNASRGANATAEVAAMPGPAATQFTPQQKSFLTAAVAASALAVNFFVVTLVNRFGIRTIFVCAGVLSAIATLLLPTAIQSGFNFTIACRILQGLAFACNFPAIGAFTSKWTYHKQNGLFVSCLVAYVQLAPALTMPISGALCESSWHWPSVFYTHGAMSIVLFALFGTFYRNSPNKHAYVGRAELNKIAVGKSKLDKKALRSVPYGAILRTASVWAIWLASIGNFTAVNLLFLYSPTFMNRVLGFPVAHSGFSSALPPLAQFAVKLSAGFTSDKVKCLSETNKLRLFNSIAFCGSATCMFILAFTPTSLPYLGLLLFGGSAGVLGFTTGGFFKAAPLVAKHYAHIVMGNISIGIAVTMLIVPFIVNGIAPNSSPQQWSYIFFVIIAVVLVSNLLFCLMADAAPAPWTTEEWTREHSGARVKPASLSSQRPPQSS